MTIASAFGVSLATENTRVSQKIGNVFIDISLGIGGQVWFLVSARTGFCYLHTLSGLATLHFENYMQMRNHMFLASCCGLNIVAR